MKQLNIKLPEAIFGLEIDLVKILLIPVFLIIFFIISLNLVVLPKISEINSINEEINQTNDKTKVVIEKKNYLMSRDQEKLKTDEEFLGSAILKEKQSYFLVGIIRLIADKYGFQIKSFSISPGKLKDDDKIKIADKEVMNRLPVSVVLVGPKENHLDLLLGLEKSLPVLVINNFKMNTTDGMAELNLDINSFYITQDIISDVTTLSLAELTVSQEESELLDKLSQFERVDTKSVVQDLGQGEFTKYNRENPFSL
jgi:hypothetical protein